MRSNSVENGQNDIVNKNEKPFVIVVKMKRKCKKKCWCEQNKKWIETKWKITHHYKQNEKPFVVTCKIRSKCKKNEKQFAIVDRMRNNSQTPTQVKKEGTLQNNEWNAMLK